MTESKPVFDQLNVVVRDMGAMVAFYRRLGLSIADPVEWPPGSGALHVEGTEPDGARLEFDNLAMAKIWHAGWRSSEPAATGVVIGFSCSTREAVDERYAELTAAGYGGCQPPYDAFWGARYAVVQDPEGNDVGLMSPIDPERRFTPSPG